MKIYPTCSILINQNVYIGNDPIGHCCYNQASYVYKHFFICEECKQKILNNDISEMTFPEINVVELWEYYCKTKTRDI